MAEVTLELIKTLREQTGAGMMDCKGALKETGGDLEEAATFLRKKGIARADKKAGRAASEGRVAARVSEDATEGILIEANCETDFVAKNEKYDAFVSDLLDHVESAKEVESHDALLAQPFVKNTDETFGEYIKATAGGLGENISLSRSTYYKLAGEGAIGSYIHMGGKVGVLIEVAAGKAETASADAFQELVKDLTLHIAASAPICIGRDEVPAEIVEKEKEVFRDQMKGKPDNIIENIIKGMVNKFYSQQVLTEQAFVKDTDKSIRDLLKDTGKALDDEITITRFTRYGLGENAPEVTEEED